MLSARQRLLMRRACDRTIGVAIAPIGTVAFLPDPDFRRRVLRCVIHVGLSLSIDGLGECIRLLRLPPAGNPAQRRFDFTGVCSGLSKSKPKRRGFSPMTVAAKM